MTKLTEAQRRVLEAMAGGGLLVLAYSEKPYAFLYPPLNSLTEAFLEVGTETYLALLYREFIERVPGDEGRGLGALHQLTPTGRAALQQSVVVEG